MFMFTSSSNVYWIDSENQGSRKTEIKFCPLQKYKEFKGNNQEESMKVKSSWIKDHSQLCLYFQEDKEKCLLGTS